MLRAALLTALEHAVDRDGDEEAARGALMKVDPLLRPLARRRLQRAIEASLLATTVVGESDQAHVMRLAYLEVACAARGVDPDDVDAVAARYQRTRAATRPPRLRMWWATALVTMAAGALAVVVTVALLRALEPEPRFDASRRLSAPPLGAFAQGGRPVANPVIRQALGEDLADVLIALDAWTKVARSADAARAEEVIAEARRALMTGELRSALGPALSTQLEVVLDRARAAAEPAREPVADAAGHELLTAVGTLNDLFAAAGLAYFVDADVLSARDDRRMVILYAFEVEHVSVYDAGDGAVRALHLRRIDRLNWTHTLLGFTGPHLRSALILLDQVDEQLVTELLPALVDGAPLALTDGAVVASWGVEANARAGDLVRDEYRRAVAAADVPEVTRVAALLARRRDLFEQWSAELDARGYHLSVPDSLRISPELDYATTLAGVVPEEELAELADLERELAEPRSERAFTAVRDVLVASIERHEVQHRVDSALPEPLPMPAALEALVGPVESVRGQERRSAAIAREELSAYLSELHRDRATTRVNLALIARFLLDSHRWGTVESYASAVVLEGLARRLGVGDGAPLIHDGDIDRPRIARLFVELAAAPEDDLRDAARALWTELFGRELPVIRRRAP